ncbi:MAG: ATP-binding cassette domain-containing protein, partial [Acidiferrobacterales bacterium]
MEKSDAPTSNHSILVEIHDLDFARGERPIFKGLTLEVRRGQVTAILGGSGTGKTTLLNLIGGRLH